MALKALRSSPFVMGVLALIGIHLPSATAQSGQVNPEQIAMPLNFSHARVVEADGTAVVTVPITFTFDNQELAAVWSAQRPLVVGFTTENGTARAGTCGTAGADYVSTSNSVPFSGQLSQSSSLQICSDDLSEGDEQFGLRLTSTENHANFYISFRPGRVPQLVTITDDEPLPTLGITPTVQIAEPSSGTANVEFVVSLTGPINQRPVTVAFNTEPGTAAAGTACPLRGANADYVTKSGTLTFSPPSNLLQSPQIPRTQRVTVAVCSDTNRTERAETFFVNLARPVNATLAGTGGLLTSPTTPNQAVTRGQATIN